MRRRPLAWLLAVALGAVVAGALGMLMGIGWEDAEGIAVALLLVIVAGRALQVARTSKLQAMRLERVERELRRAQAARDRFLVGLVNAQEAEARKVADLLHDDVVQQLTALGFRLELESQRNDLPRLKEIARDASSITASIRRLLVELHPAILASQGLGPAVDVVAEPLRERGVDVRVSAFPHRLPRELETLTYRLVQEALANVQRHSGARRAEVDLRIADGVLRARITDDGSGATLDEASADGLGLHVGRERVELAGGRFLVQARPGHGTDVVFELPVPPADTSTEAVS
jgi:two-component system sensor histidine kinase UhpB